MSLLTPQWQLRQIVKRLERIASELTITDQAQIEAIESYAEGLTRVAEAITPPNRPDLLTPAQTKVLAFIRRRITQEGEAPTRKEIAEAFGFSSPNAAQEHVRALERKGHISLTGEARGIRVNKRDSTLSLRAVT